MKNVFTRAKVLAFLGNSLLATLAILPVTAFAKLTYAPIVIHTFDASKGEGPSPITLGADGNIYGALTNGDIFKVDSTGAVTIVYSAPAGTISTFYNLVSGSDGNLYSLVFVQPSASSIPPPGLSLVMTTPEGKLSVIYTFDNTVGPYPASNLIQGSDGAFYGVLSSANNCGMVFRITTAGTFSTFASLASAPTPSCSEASLIQGHDGNLYGTIIGLGADPSTVFKITPAGTLSYIHTFVHSSFSPNNSQPTLLSDSGKGELYGVSHGTVFSVDSNGRTVTLHTFNDSNVLEGTRPISVVMGSDGYLYGSTLRGGTGAVTVDTYSGIGPSNPGNGTLFRIKPDGTGYQLLYSFASPFNAVQNDTDGLPSNLILDKSGGIVGVSSDAIFRLPAPPSNWNMGPAPTIRISASPKRLNYVKNPAATSTLTWSTSNADSCYASPSLYADWTGLQNLQGTTTVPSHASDIYYAFRFDGANIPYTLACVSTTGTFNKASVKVKSVPFKYVGIYYPGS